MDTNNPGIDYGLGMLNIDRETGIRYGIISQNDILQAWADSSEPNYGDPHCPHCGNPARDAHEDCGDDALAAAQEDYTCDAFSFGDYACDSCKRLFGGQDAFGDEPLSFVLDDGEYLAESDAYGDIFILKAPFYTHAQFCSPCAPGAGHLGNPCADGPRTYCFGHDWFDDGAAPYPVYRVADGVLVNP